MTSPTPAAVLQAVQHAAGQEVPEPLPESPLPGGVAAAVRFFFHVPQWIQIGGAVVAAVVGVLVAVYVWRRRRAVLVWLAGRPPALKAGLVAVALAGVLVAAGFGRTSWDYMQHDNDFCTGCHIMGPSYERFTQSEHADLLCHDCHRQSIFASARQLYLWVLERPEEIGPHAPVPNQVCAECHIQERPDSLWQRIAATAGHRVHLESDTSALAEVMCVTCHGQEVHRFVPADQTCGQADCHAEETTGIVLGAMAGQTGFHCVACHEFTARVSEAVALDTAAAALVPRRSHCFSCHDMEALMGGFDAAADPHEAVCGDCHDPHRQETPEAAFATCTEGGCHAEPDTLSPFHRGIAPAVLDDCGACHGAHEWTIEGENCAACHPSLARRAGASGGGLAAAPFHPWSPAGRASGPQTAAGTWSTAVHGASSGGAITSVPLPPSAPRVAPPAQEAPFRHTDHEGLACKACHSSTEAHGRVTVRAPGDCFSCHHEGTVAGGVECAACHGPTTLAGAEPVRAELRLAVREEPLVRRLPFDHADHAGPACADCHAGSRMQTTASCADCHADHHVPEAACESCHTQKPPEDAHTVALHESASCGGSGCHAGTGPTAERVAYGALSRTRSFCLSCHQDQVDHEPGESCAECHQVPEPAAGAGAHG